MIEKSVLDEIDALAERYPRRRSALAPALMKAQDSRGGFLARADVTAVAQLLGVGLAQAYAVVTYYSMFNKFQVGRHHLRVDSNLPAMLSGAREIVRHLRDRLGVDAEEMTGDGLFTYSLVEDLASGGSGPALHAHGRYYENLTPEKVDALLDELRADRIPEWPSPLLSGGSRDILLRNIDIPGMSRLETARSHGAYLGLAAAFAMSPEALIREVKEAMLRGRGGAGFPTGMKWSYVSRDEGKPTYLICNADEGEPGTFKDRMLLEFDPHLVLEGMAIASRALGVRTAFIYIRGEFGWLADGLEKAIEEARGAGVMDIDIIVHRGAGSYVCGEESALIESLEGRRGQPRLRPPYPVASGLYGCPTVVHNVETLSCLPFILREGAGAFLGFGTELSRGTKLFSVCGHVARPGVYEFPLGTPLVALLEAAGGILGAWKAVVVGGLSSPILKASEAENLHLDFESLSHAGSALGSGGVMVLNDSVDMPEFALRALEFYAAESCGQCTICREGSGMLASLLRRLVSGQGSIRDLNTLSGLCATMDGATLCPLGTSFARVVGGIFSKFEPEFRKRLSGIRL
jgi:NADH:ubiquinone oxidoreductase subunit F (NADH-binding)/NADH:ubiquinone oxidoreductase subunit E